MTFSDAQAAFRQFPNQSTALAYMDAAIAEWEEVRGDELLHWIQGDERFVGRVKEIRNWLAIPITDFGLRLRDVEDATVRAAVAKLKDPDATR
jgi:hypothetical protein